MSIASALENAQAKVENAYTAVEEKGGTLPETQNLSNLPEAIESIPSGGGSGDYIYLENKSGATITADKKVLCNLSAATSEPQKFLEAGSTVYNPLCVYDNDNFVATFQSGMGSVLFSDGGLKEVKRYTSSLSYLAGLNNNFIYHPNGIISTCGVNGWTGYDSYIVSGLNTLVTIPNKCQYLGSYDGTHYVFDRREGYHSIRTYDPSTNTIGTEVVSVPDVNYLYYGYMRGNQIFVYKQDFYAIYELQSATTATLLYSGSVSGLEPMYMAGNYIISTTSYAPYFDISNNGNRVGCLRLHWLNIDGTLARVHFPELEMFETTPCYICYDNRSDILSIGTHNYAYFYKLTSSEFKRINVVFDEFPSNYDNFAKRAFMTPNKNKVIVECKHNEYYFYDVKYPEQFISVDNSLTYSKDSNITGYATGNTSSGKYEISTILPSEQTVNLTVGELVAEPDEIASYGGAGEVVKIETKDYDIPVYNNVPYKLIARREGFYDIVWDYLCYPLSFPLMASSGIYKSYTGKSLSYAINDNDLVSISIPSGELPDKSVCDSLVGCLATANNGTCYDNFNIVGSAFADKKTGFATNFSTSNYITKDLESLGNNWEIYLKIKTPATAISGGQKVFALGTASASNGYVYGYISNSGTAMWWIIDSFDTGTFSISNNTTYYFKAGCDGEKTYLYMSTTGYGSMTLIKEESTVVSVPPYTMFLGYNTTLDPKGAFKGIIDLSQTYIKVNGSVYWSANSGKYALSGTTYGNYVTVGSPTINSGVVSNFSSSDYLTVPLGNLGNVWDIYLKFTTSSSTVTGGQEIFTIAAEGETNGFVYCYVANAGTSLWWNVDDWSTVNQLYSISNSTTYYFKVGCDGEKTYAYVSTTGYDSMTLIKEDTVVKSVPEYTLFLGYNTTQDIKGAFKGSIDLSQTYITVDGKMNWSGKNVTSAIGLLPSGVTDDGSAQTWNLFYDNGVFVADTTSPMTGYSWCGSVTVPAHGVPTPPSHNFTVIGSLSESDGVYSGFGNDEYIELDTNLLVAGYTYIFKVTTGNDLSYFQNILAPDNWFELYVENGDLKAWVGHSITSGTLQAETTYWVKVETTANSVTLSYSTDGITYTGAVTDSCEKYPSQQFNVGHGILDYWDRNWNGSIDMTNSHIYYNGNTVW